jgi:hypothetical protein
VALDSRQLINWDRHLQDVVHLINTQYIESHGFSPAEILFGFSPRHSRLPTLEEAVNAEGAAITVDVDLQPAVEGRSARIQEARDLIREGRETSPPLLTSRLTKGDLVLLWDTVLEKDKGRKLNPRWKGPFRLRKLSYHKQSAILEDIVTRLWVSQYHVDHLKRFVARSDDAIAEATELRRRLQERNYEVKRLIKETKGSSLAINTIPVEPEESYIWKGGGVDLHL